MNIEVLAEETALPGVGSVHSCYSVPLHFVSYLVANLVSGPVHGFATAHDMSTWVEN